MEGFSWPKLKAAERWQGTRPGNTDQGGCDMVGVLGQMTHKLQIPAPSCFLAACS